VAELAVWLGGRHVANLREVRGAMTLLHTAEARPLGAPRLSMSMPVSRLRYRDNQARPFIQGLLPEGEARRMIAYDLGLSEADDFGLIEALGKDCAGALVVQPVTDDPPPASAPAGLEVLDDVAVADRLRALPTNPLGVDGMIRVSLPGMQPKLLLARDRAGQWALPLGGAVSTHILKPRHPHLPDAVANEALCMRIAHHSGVASATTDIAVFDGIETLVSTRFDRRVNTDGGVTRVHQEDACQALSILTRHPQMKYEGTGGPTLASIAGLLDQWADPGAVDDLVVQVAFNAIVGNADYHGKNVSFVLGDDAVRLAPLYDAMSTVCYDGLNTFAKVDQSLGLRVAGKRDINEVRMHDIVLEAEGWGLPRKRSVPILERLLERLPEAVTTAADELSRTPAALVRGLRARVQVARDELGAGA